MTALSYPQHFKKHEEHFLLLLQTQGLCQSVYIAIQGIEDWLSNSEKHEQRRFIADSDPWTTDALWATWGIDSITAATVLSQTDPSLTQLQCQLLRVLYHLLASQLHYASTELVKLGGRLKAEIPQHGLVSDDIARVFWSYVILERYKVSKTKN